MRIYCQQYQQRVCTAENLKIEGRRVSFTKQDGEKVEISKSRVLWISKNRKQPTRICYHVKVDHAGAALKSVKLGDDGFGEAKFEDGSTLIFNQKYNRVEKNDA